MNFKITAAYSWTVDLYESSAGQCFAKLRIEFEGFSGRMGTTARFGNAASVERLKLNQNSGFSIK